MCSSPNSLFNEYTTKRDFELEEIQRQLLFLTKFKSSNIIPFNLPKDLQVIFVEDFDFHYKKDDPEKLYTIPEELETFLDKCSDFIEHNKLSARTESFIYHMKCIIIKDFLKANINYSIDPNNYHIGFNKKLLLSQPEIQSLMVLITTNIDKPILEAIELVLNQIKDYDRRKVNGGKFVDIINPFLESFNNLNNYTKEKSDNVINLSLDTLEPLFNFFKYYAEIPYLRFNFRWRNLSSGEEAFLNLYARLFHATLERMGETAMNNNHLKTICTPNFILEKSNNVLILMDEGDISFHPEWQQKYLDSLLKFLSKIFLDKQIQIILTTHSPFLISDLPRENIIFLEKGNEGYFTDEIEKLNKCIVVNGLKKEQTFGANIHTLLSDSFFLDSGLIGEFSKNKIIKLVLDIENISNKSSDIDIQNLEILISLVGEPVLQEKLIKMFDAKLKKDEPKERKLKRLEKEKRKLEEEIQSLEA